MLHQTMQQSNLIKKIRLTTLSLLFISGVAQASDPIGDVIESIGVSSILRDKESITDLSAFPIEFYD